MSRWLTENGEHTRIIITFSCYLSLSLPRLSPVSSVLSWDIAPVIMTWHRHGGMGTSQFIFIFLLLDSWCHVDEAMNKTIEHECLCTVKAQKVIVCRQLNTVSSSSFINLLFIGALFINSANVVPPMRSTSPSYLLRRHPKSHRRKLF